MSHCTVATLAFLFLLGGFAPGAGSANLPAPPHIDKSKLEAYIRYFEAYTPMVKMSIEDPTASEFPGLYRVAIHLTLGPQLLDKIYFVSADGGQVVNGNVWNMAASPFADTLARLPRSGPSFGPADAKVTMVVFSDFQCPYCREFARTIRLKLPAKYGHSVRVIFANYPIESIHKWALPAAEIGNCFAAQSSDSFWAYHDWVFEHQGELTPENVQEKSAAFAASQTGALHIDPAALHSCAVSPKTAADVRRSIADGVALGVQQTPTFFVNGRLVGGAVAWNSLEALIDLELNRPASVPGPVADGS